MKKVVYSVGYTAFEQEELIGILKELSISCLIDVRSVPMSSYSPQYNKGVFDKVLKENGIRYRNYQEFGARQDDANYYSDDDYLDFDKYVKSELFISGMEKVEAGINLGFRFVFMCAEKDPINCHRAIMVTRAFSESGYEVFHIRPHKEKKYYLESQGDLEKRLVKLNGDNIDQLSLFENDEVRICRAYKKQNRMIGFRKEEE